MTRNWAAIWRNAARNLLRIIVPALTLRGGPQAVNPVVRDEAYRNGREALTNAFQHSHVSSNCVSVIMAMASTRQFEMTASQDIGVCLECANARAISAVSKNPE